MSVLTRRSLLTGALALTGLSGGTTAFAATVSPGTATRTARVGSDPFTLGVASGDPRHDSVVLWTRLAPRPLDPDGRGGMPSLNVPVEWQVAADATFTNVVRAGTYTAVPEYAHSVHVEPSGLEPAREYYYRFRARGHLSLVGRTQTTPAPDKYGTAITVGLTSCAHFEEGYFTAYRAMAADNPDLVLALGDYIYEYGRDHAKGTSPRRHLGLETTTLGEYRVRHAQYKSDDDLQAAHAVAPWLLIFDDHEIDNNWAGNVHEHPEKRQAHFVQRRSAALRAFWEHMPLRRTSLPRGPLMQLYHVVRWGRLAQFYLLDTRQYRGDQPCGDGWARDCAARFTQRAMLGSGQEKWLNSQLGSSDATWNLLAQQVMMAARDRSTGPDEWMAMDTWDGYVSARNRLLGSFQSLRVPNPIVLTGDSHVHMAAELRPRFADPDSPVVAPELLTPSVSSGGDGVDLDPEGQAFLAANGHLKFYSAHRGYVRTRISGNAMRADFRALPFVSEPGTETSTRASYVLESGDPHLHRL